MITRAARLTAALAAVAGAASPAATCTLELSDDRSGVLMRRVPVAQAEVVVGFTHSVLGTPVRDRYVWSGGQWRLVEERFEGAGYGLPHGAQPGEKLLREGNGWRLVTDRVIDPLVVRDVPGADMHIEAAGAGVWRLHELGARSLRVTAARCSATAP